MMLFMMLLLLLLLFFALAVAVAGVFLVLLSFLWGRLWIRTTLNIAVLFKVFNTAVFLFFLVLIVAPTLSKVFYQVLPPSSGAY